MTLTLVFDHSGAPPATLQPSLRERLAASLIYARRGRRPRRIVPCVMQEALKMADLVLEECAAEGIEIRLR